MGKSIYQLAYFYISAQDIFAMNSLFLWVLLDESNKKKLSKVKQWKEVR